MNDLLNIGNINFEQTVQRLHPAEHQLDKGNYSCSGAPFSDLNLSISNGTVSTNTYHKRDDFAIVNVPFHDGDIP